MDDVNTSNVERDKLAISTLLPYPILIVDTFIPTSRTLLKFRAAKINNSKQAGAPIRDLHVDSTVSTQLFSSSGPSSSQREQTKTKRKFIPEVQVSLYEKE